MAKQYVRTSHIHTPAPDREGKRDIRITTAPVRLDRNPAGQNRKAPEHPQK